MRLVETIENQIRNFGRNRVSPELKRQAWFYYMEGKRMVETRSFNMFGQVRVETNTHCNRACSYCSVSRFPKVQQFIDIGLYTKIIDELVSVNYRGRFSPNLSSEPTLDPRLPELIAIARKMDNARIVLYTNGDFLERKTFDALNEAGVDDFIITQHGASAPRGLTELMGNLTDGERRKVTYQTLNGVHLFNRGIPGLIAPEKRTIPNPCFLADELTILVDGKVAQCGNDFRGETVFGNISQRSIMSIWNDEPYRAFRSQVHDGQFKSDVCQRCVFDKPPTDNFSHQASE